MKYEFKKINNKKNWIMLLVLLGLYIVICYVHLHGVNQAGGENLYQELAKPYEGAVTTEHIDEITKEHDAITQIINKSQQMEQDYISGKVPYDDYLEYTNKLHDSKEKEKSIERLYQQLNADYEKNADFFIDSYLNYILKPNRIQWELLVIIIVLYFSSFSCEKSKLIAICNSTKKGMNQIYKDKMKWNIFLMLVVTTIFHLVDLLFVIKFDGVNHFGMSAVGVEVLRDKLKGPLSVGGVFFVRYLAYLFIGVVLLLVIRSCLLIKPQNERRTRK